MTESAEQPTVRFSSVQQEIEPEMSLQSSDSMAEPERRADLTEQEKLELRNVTAQLQPQKSKLQSTRMGNFNYEPVSLPVSRVPSGSSGQTQQSDHATPKHTPPTSAIHTPPLTPAASGSREHRPGTGHGKFPEPTVVTPQISPPHEAPPTSMPSAQLEQRSSAAARARLPVSSGSSRPRSMYEMGGGGVPVHPRESLSQTAGPAGDSLPPSADASPSVTPMPGTPGLPSGAQSPSSRPYTPVSGEAENPYARSRRAAQERSLDTADARFVFGGRNERPMTTYLPHSASSIALSNAKAPDKRMSMFGGKHADSEKEHKHQHSSMSELKRFFKLGSKKEKKEKEHKRDKSPGPGAMGSIYDRSASGTRTPPSQRSSLAVPFSDDHGLESRYGKFGKMLGSGAGGSVRIMKRGSDGVTFAVKQFRDRHSYESEKEYNKKVTAEFCIGSTLHHGNIIETMDIVFEKGKWYEVMEYAPYDLFAIVMTGKMGKEEVSCATLQILSGLTYLHEMGLAHRDMKLDNVVVNEHGIMKIIDFGSAVVFKYPYEDDIVLASGIVGSDPYLAPEVYDQQKYDPQPTDIWSLAIIFCCMSLRRFPWKAPRVSDNSYKLFISEPSEEERKTASYPQRTSISDPPSRMPSGGTDAASTSSHHHHHHKSSNGGNSDAASTVPVSSTSSTTSQSQQPAVIKGPWRLLRLLPRETRHIVGRMLELDPKNRATLREIEQDPWVQKTAICQQEDGGNIFKVETHTHTLEPSGETPTPVPSKK